MTDVSRVWRFEMATRTSAVIIGTKGTVLAVDRNGGDTLWSTELKGGDFVDVMIVDGDMFARVERAAVSSRSGKRRDPLVQRTARYGLEHRLDRRDRTRLAPPRRLKRDQAAAAAAAQHRVPE